MATPTDSAASAAATPAMDSWVDPYVSGRLSPEDEEQFEDYLLEHPELAQQVEDGLRLRRGLSRVAAEQTVAVLGSAAVATRRRGPWAAGTVVAGLALAASLAWLVPRVGDLERQLAEASAPRAGTPIVALEATRGIATGDLPTLTLGHHPWLILTLEPSLPDADFYLVHLERGQEVATAGGGSLWRSPPIASDGLGRVVVTLPTDLLVAGPHSLRVEGLDGDGPAIPAGSFGFEVVRPADRDGS